MTTMTANYPTAQAYPIPDAQRHPFWPQQLSPASSGSPSSPQTNDTTKPPAPNPFKQLRPLKSPLYVPAVLRPTEHFSTPMTPPKSQHGSIDSLGAEEANVPDAQMELDLDALATDFLELGEVTGPPTHEHWKPDQASPQCDSPHCSTTFNIFVRKHHCRHCGHIFCATHATRTIPLDQNAQFHPEGTLSRACEVCFRQYRRWETMRSLQRKNSQNSRDDGSDSGPPTPLAGPRNHRRMISGGMGSGSRSGGAEQVASSVPKDWAWSTF